MAYAFGGVRAKALRFGQIDYSLKGESLGSLAKFEIGRRWLTKSFSMDMLVYQSRGIFTKHAGKRRVLTITLTMVLYSATFAIFHFIPSNSTKNWCLGKLSIAVVIYETKPIMPETLAK